MAYDKDNRKLYTTTDASGKKIGISLWEIYDCLRYNKVDQRGNRNLGMVIVNGNINKWARNKPIEYPSAAPLTDEQRKGSAEEQAKGIFYGIEIVGGTNIAIKDLASIHNVDFVYHKPTTRFRALDFDGYNHLAQPQPYASMPHEGYHNDSEDDGNDLNGQGLMGIQVGYNASDKTGVDLMDRLVGTDLNDTMTKAFPCIVLTKSDGRTFFTALDYEGGDARPLLVGSNYASGNWTCQMSKPLYNAAALEPLDSPFNDDEIVTASVCLIKSASATAPLLTIGGINYGENWVLVSNALLGQAQPFVVAGANGVSLSLKTYYSAIIFEPTSVAGLFIANRNVTITVSYQEITGRSSDKEITIRVRVNIDGYGSVTTERTLNGWTAGTQNIVPISAAFNFPHIDGTKYSGSVTLTTIDGTKSNTRTLDFTNIG